MPYDNPYAYHPRNHNLQHRPLVVTSSTDTPGHPCRPSPFTPRAAVGNDACAKVSPTSSNPPQSPDSSIESDSWACDYCQFATFKTYQEACEHESTCPMNQNLLSTNHSHSSYHPSETHYNCPHSAPSHAQMYPSITRLLLTTAGDKQNLSDRQCYVRSQFVEIFEATEADVSSRHSKGAQKLNVGQVGIRCMHCLFVSAKDRAERSTCYPSSISRIYQTVADMQRFHFEACSGIPAEMKSVYRSLKTTRPRGQGSPQSFWISSAKEIGLVDTDEGIRYPNKGKKATTHSNVQQEPNLASSLSSLESAEGCVRSLTPSSPETGRLTSLPPLSPESHGTASTHSFMQQDRDSNTFMSERETRDAEANMLLALKGGSVSVQRTFI